MPFPACCTVLTELSLDDTCAHHIVQVRKSLYARTRTIERTGIKFIIITGKTFYKASINFLYYFLRKMGSI